MDGHRTDTADVGRIRLGLAALLAAAACTHVVAPGPFEALVPDWLPGPRGAWNLAAAVAEGSSAALLARRSTAGTGGWAALATFAVVWVANIEAARRGGYPGLPAPLDGPVAAWLRVPLQVPLLWWAWRVARAGRGRHGVSRRGRPPR